MKKAEKMKENLIKEYQTTENILSDLQQIIETSQRYAYQAVNEALVIRNWLIGYRIHLEEMKEENRAEYGMQIIQNMAKELTKLYGRGFGKSNLYSFYNLYKYYPNIFRTPSGKSQKILSWSHYYRLINVPDKEARDWYTKSLI